MASTHKSLRSSTASKRPTTSIADGQIALNTNAASPGLFFKDSTGADIIKVGPVHVGTTAPNATPASGGSTGNSTGEVWLDTSLTPVGVKIWDGSAWQNATPAGSTTVQGLLELATNGETQTGTDTARAVTPAGLQSKLSDSTSTTSSTTIASSTAVKSAYDLANAALPKSGGVITGNLEIGATGSLTFEGATDNAFETALAVVDPTADRTITFPDRTGTVITNADTGTVTSTMIADGTIVNADVNASAAIAGTKISPNFGAQNLTVDNHVLYVDATTDRVGIGTTSPSEKLDISNGVIRVVNTTLPSSETDGAAYFGKITGGAEISHISFVALRTAAQERARIDSSGRLGLGTSSPQGTLNVQGGGTSPSVTYDTNDIANFDAGGVQFAVGINSSSPFGAFLQARDNANAARAISLNPAGGNVGIGTASPNASLEIINTAGGDLFAVQGAGSDVFKINSSSDAINLDTRNASGGLNFQIQGSDKARIDNSGRLLVGTSTSITALVQAGLQVQSTGANSYASIGRWVNTTANPGLIFNKSRGAAVGTFGAVNANDNLGEISFTGDDGSSFIYGARIQAQVDGTPGADDMPGRLLFLTTADGANSPTERLRIDSSGNVGIGTTAPDSLLEVRDSSASGIISRSSLTQGTNTNKALKVRNNSDTDTFSVSYRGQGYFADSLGIGTTSPHGTLSVEGEGRIVTIGDSGVANRPIIKSRNSDDTGYAYLHYDAFEHRFYDSGVISYVNGRDTHVFSTSNSERARIDSSGRLLVGTSTSVSQFGVTPQIQLTGTSGSGGYQGLTVFNTAQQSAPNLVLGHSKGASVGTYTASVAGDLLGEVSFTAGNGTDMRRGASIGAWAEDTWAVGDHPARLVFSTTADGASSPTERMRIKKDGTINFSNVAVYADNVVAKMSGLVDGDVYRTSTGDLKIVYT